MAGGTQCNPPFLLLSGPDIGMRVLVTFTIGASLLVAGCGFHRSVYNGGLSPGESRTLESPAQLRPSEAGVTFRTDYAPPQPNATYAGPTNRVRVDVPVPAPERTYVTLKSSQSSRVMRSAGNSRVSVDQAQVASNTDSAQPHLVAGQNVPGSVAAPSQEMSLGNTKGMMVRATSSGWRSQSETGTIHQAQDTAATTSTQMPANVQDLGDSNALQQPGNASQPLKAGTSNAVAGYERINAPRGAASPSTVASNTDAAMTAERSDANATRDVALAGQAMAAGTSVASRANTVVNAAAARQDASAPQGFTGADAARLLVGRDVVAGFGNAQFLLQPTATNGTIVYKRFLATRTMKTGEAVSSSADVGSLTTTAAAGNAQEFADINSTGEAFATNSVLDVDRANALAGFKAVHGLRTEAWTSTTASTVAIVPPNMFVLKEARLVDAPGIEKLLASGVLKDRPRGKWLIAYRISVLNATGSVAKSVRILERLDASTTLLVNSMATTSEAASAQYSPDLGALEVTLPSLDSGGYFVFEFFVEP